MLQLNLEEAITIVDYYNWKIRAFDRKTEEEIWAISNKAMKENGLEWCSLILGYEKNQIELSRNYKQNKIDRDAYLSERKRLKEILEKKEAEYIKNHKSKQSAIHSRKREVKGIIKQVQTA